IGEKLIQTGVVALQYAKIGQVPQQQTEDQIKNDQAHNRSHLTEKPTRVFSYYGKNGLHWVNFSNSEAILVCSTLLSSKGVFCAFVQSYKSRRISFPDRATNRTL